MRISFVIVDVCIYIYTNAGKEISSAGGRRTLFSTWEI